MPTLYVTAEEYEALGEAEIQAIKAAGEDVVVVGDNYAAEQASWAEAMSAGAKDDVPDVDVSFLPVSRQGLDTPISEPVEAMPSAEERQIALLGELVAVQREHLAETRALRSDMAKALTSSFEQPPAMATPTRPYVPVDTSALDIDFSPLDKALKSATQNAVQEDAGETIRSMIEALDAEIAKVRDESNSS